MIIMNTTCDATLLGFKEAAHESFSDSFARNCCNEKKLAYNMSDALQFNKQANTQIA